MVEITLIAAFVAGFLSFLSPCVLPLLPGFLAYLAGTSVGKESSRLPIFLNSVAYVLGFSLVFSLIGVLFNTVLDTVSFTVQMWLSRIGGAIIIFFGLYLLGVIKLKFLQQEHTFHVKKFNISYVTSFVFGASFAVGWSPCIGAVLGSVLTLAITNPGQSFVLLFAYTMGLGIPFLLVGIFSKEAMGLIKKLGPALKYFNIVVGILLVLLGILVFTQTLAIVANFGFINFL